MSGSPEPTRIERAWQLLEDVADPEIPVLSVVDLGIVRVIEERADALLAVGITPTYGGCPATAVIAADIRACLEQAGLVPLSVETLLTPPWSTTWISERGRRKLSEYGIAPPLDSDARQKPACPRCGSSDTREISRFGSTPCKALYSCLACLEPFDYFKCH